MKMHLLAGLALLLGACGARAEVRTKPVEYSFEGVTLKGHLAWDDAVKGKRPGVLVVHEWWGLDEYARSRAAQLAKLGYVALAVDMYGEGKTTEHPKEAGQMAGEVRKNVKTWVGRAQAGLKVLRSQEMVDADRIAAIGYCFGGSTVLQLAFSGADVDAVVSFHGALPVPSEEQAQAARKSGVKILVCHGAADSFIPENVVQMFREALNRAGVDYKFVAYPGARHSFTVPGADKRGIDGIKYNAEADQASWQAMKDLFAGVFKDR